MEYSSPSKRFATHLINSEILSDEYSSILLYSGSVTPQLFWFRRLIKKKKNNKTMTVNSWLESKLACWQTPLDVTEENTPGVPKPIVQYSTPRFHPHCPLPDNKMLVVVCTMRAAFLPFQQTRVPISIERICENSIWARSAGNIIPFVFCCTPYNSFAKKNR